MTIKQNSRDFTANDKIIPDPDDYRTIERKFGRLPDNATAARRAQYYRLAQAPGLATDFCVAWTAIDGRHAGLNVYVVDDACRGIDINGSLAAAWKDMTDAGVKKIESGDIG